MARNGTVALALTLALAGVARGASDPAADAIAAALDADLSGSDAGVAVAVWRDGATIHESVRGRADAERGVDLTPDTPLYLASTAKQFTAACIFLLAADHALSLDDDVRKHIPELPEYRHVVRLRHLLHHRSGIPDVYESAILADIPRTSLKDSAAALEILRRLDSLDFVPDSQFVYSNSNYVLLAEVVHRVSGKTLAEFARERLFGPLGMTSTSFVDDEHGPPANAAVGHSASGAVRDMPRIAGPGGLWSTVHDLGKWDANFFTPKVGGPALIAALTTVPALPAGTSWSPDIGPYAGGLIVCPFRGSVSVSHPGGAFGFRSEILRLPEKHLTCVCLTNSETVDARGWCRRLAGIALGPPFDAPPRPASGIATAKVSVQPLIGLFRERDGGGLLSIAQRGDAFRATMVGTIVPLEQDGTGALVGSETPIAVRVEPAAAGSIRLRIGDATPREFATVERIASGAGDPTPIAGTYHHSGLDATITLAARDGSVVFEQHGVPLLPIEPFGPLVADSWVGARNAVLLEVERASDGKVGAVVFRSRGARGMRFERVRD